MSGSRKCPCCSLHYIGRDDVACWCCLNGYDPRGPSVSSSDPIHCRHCRVLSLAERRVAELEARLAAA